jgi:hypothetical protein
MSKHRLDQELKDRQKKSFPNILDLSRHHAEATTHTSKEKVWRYGLTKLSRSTNIFHHQMATYSLFKSAFGMKLHFFFFFLLLHGPQLNIQMSM